MKKIICLMGKSGSGKDAIAAAILKNSDIRAIRLCTTRPMRENESEGNPYHFITEDEIDQEMVAKTVFHTKHGDWYYGFVNEELEPEYDYLAIINPYQMPELENLYGDQFELEPVLIDTESEERLIHLIDREEANGKDFEEVCRRIKTDAFDFSEENEVFKRICESGSMIYVFNNYEITPDEIAMEFLYNIERR